MHQRKLLEFFNARWKDGQPLALATVFATEGSTYSKAGARMLIDANGVFQGMLSGGCLEGDLAIRARAVIDSLEPQVVTYDLGNDGDELWGLGVGCDGLMRVFLQPLTEQRGYEPFATMIRIVAGDSPAVAATVISSAATSAPAGASVLLSDDCTQHFDLDAPTTRILESRCRERLASGNAVLETHAIAGEDVDVLYSLIEPPPNVLILGAGLDAEPLVKFASELGWRCTVSDHRPAYIESNQFDDAEQTLCSAAEDIHKVLDLDRFDMAVVMSHHLASDRAYLHQLTDTRISYIGLLGPVGRKARLLDEIGESAMRLQHRLHGPAGIDLRGSGPVAIALSIVAEMQLALGAGNVRRWQGRAGNSG